MTIYFLFFKKLFRPEKFNLCSGAQVKPFPSGLRTGWVTHREDRLKGPYVVLSFLLLLFAYYVVLLLTVYWKADLALFLRPDLEKEENKEQIWPGAVHPKIIILWAVVQSLNFADFDLYIGGETGKLRNLGFRQCKTIIMPLIPISYSSVSCCRRCLRCAKRCSFCSAVSCWRLLLRCSRWIWSRHSPEDFHFANYRFSFRKLQILISQTTDSHFANYRFSFCFVPFRFANYRKPCDTTECSFAPF